MFKSVLQHWLGAFKCLNPSSAQHLHISMNTGSLSSSPDSNSVTRPPMRQLLSSEVHLKLWHPSILLQSRAQLIDEEATDADSWEKLLALNTSLYVLVPDWLFIVSIFLPLFVANIDWKLRENNKINVNLIIFMLAMLVHHELSMDLKGWNLRSLTIILCGDFFNQLN